MAGCCLHVQQLLDVASAVHSKATSCNEGEAGNSRPSMAASSALAQVKQACYDTAPLVHCCRYFYISIVYNVSYTFALYGLLLFWIGATELLQPFNPLLKFVLVKSVVFLTFWQVSGLFGTPKPAPAGAMCVTHTRQKLQSSSIDFHFCTYCTLVIRLQILLVCHHCWDSAGYRHLLHQLTRGAGRAW